MEGNLMGESKGSLALRAVMKRKVITVDAADTASTAAEVMTRNGVGCVVVTDKQNAVGIITERDMVRVLSKSQVARGLKAMDIMSTPIIAVEPSMEIVDAVEFMIKKNIKKLPIVEQGKLVGIVTFTDFAMLQPAIAHVMTKLLASGQIPPRFMKYTGSERPYVV